MTGHNATSDDPTGETPTHCCTALADQVGFICDQHPEIGGCPDYLIGHQPHHDTYGLWIHTGENGSAGSALTITHCPFCGTTLPEDRSDEWWDRLEALGIDDPDDAPEGMRRYGWWKV